MIDCIAIIIYLELIFIHVTITYWIVIIIFGNRSSKFRNLNCVLELMNIIYFHEHLIKIYRMDG